MSISLVPSASPAPAPQRYSGGEEYVSWGLVSGMVRRRWPALLLCLALSIGLAMAYLMVTPPTYEAAASILVEDEKLNMPELVKRLTNESDVNTQVELLRSARLSQEVVNDLGLRLGVLLPTRTPRSRLLGQAAVSDSADTTTVVLTRQGAGYFRARNLTTGAAMDSITAGEKVALDGVAFTLKPAAFEQSEIRLSVGTLKGAMIGLSEQVKIVRPDRDANVIWIRSRGIDPEITGRVPDLMAQHYIDGRIAATRGKVQTAVQYLRGQADTMQAQLMAAEEQLKNYRERAGIVSLHDEAVTAVNQNADLSTVRARLEAERSALQHVMSEADTTSPGTGPSPYRRLAAFPTLVNNPTVSDLLHTLNDLETQQAQILLRRTPADPDAKAIAGRISDVDGQLRNWTKTYLQGLQSHVTSLDAQVSSKTRSAASLPAKGMEEERLSRRPRMLGDVYSLLETRLQEARIAESAADPGVTIIDRAGVPEKPVWPRPFLILAVAGAVGLLLGGALAWMRDTMDTAVHSRAEAINATGVPVLGMIPHIEMLRRKRGREGPPLLISNSVPTLGARLGNRHGGDKAKAMLIGGAEASAAALEAYAWLETSLALARPNGELRTVAFTSPLSREGKTVTASNLALSAAWRGRKVLLIDADLRRGMTHHLFGISRDRGLAEVLAGTTQLTQAIRIIPLGNGATVHVLPCGDRTGHPAGLFRSGGMSGLLEAFRARYDLVIIDTPPVNLVSDSLILSQLVDGVVLVARSGQTDATSLAQASRHLIGAGAPLLGVLLNDINVARDGSYDDAFRYLDEAGAYAAAGPATDA
jgi:capsular exopolysaccharide synthesis family protein